jgi:hypothetical protein
LTEKKAKSAPFEKPQRVRHPLYVANGLPARRVGTEEKRDFSQEFEMTGQEERESRSLTAFGMTHQKIKRDSSLRSE